MYVGVPDLLWTLRASGVTLALATTKDQTFDAKVITDLSVHYQHTEILGFGIGINNILNVYPDKIDTKGDVVTDLGGRFVYPWEVNQFGFNGITMGANIRLSF